MQVLQLNHALQLHGTALEVAEANVSQKGSEIAGLRTTLAVVSAAAEQRTQQLQLLAEQRQQEADATMAALQGRVRDEAVAADAAASAAAADLAIALCALRFVAAGNAASSRQIRCTAAEGTQSHVPSSPAAAAAPQNAAGLCTGDGDAAAAATRAVPSILQRAQQLAAAAAEAKATFVTQQQLLRRAAAERLTSAQHTTQLQANMQHLQAWAQEPRLSAADCRL